jgi:outer membrane protein TolC
MKKTLLLPLLIFYPISVFAITLEEAISYAEKNSNNIKLEDYKLEATKTLKIEAISSFLPNVRANLRYGQKKDNYNPQDKSFDNEGIEEIRIEQPLFDGMRSVSKYQEAGYKIKSALALNKDKKQEIAFNAANVYLELFRYQEVAKLQKENKEFADKILSLANRRKEVRILDESEIVKFNYEASAIEEKYLNSASKLLKAQFDYQNVIGKLDDNLRPPILKSDVLEPDSVIATILAKNHYLQSYHYNYLASKLTYSAEKSKLLPSVSLAASISKEKNVAYLRGKDLSAKSISLNIAIPIFSGGVEYANIIRAKNQSLISLKEYEISKDNLLKESAKAIEEYQFLTKLNIANKKLADLAQRRKNIIDKRFIAGFEDPIELMRSKLELNERKIEYLNSEIDLNLAYYKIKYYLGEINDIK